MVILLDILGASLKIIQNSALTYIELKRRRIHRDLFARSLGFAKKLDGRLLFKNQIKFREDIFCLAQKGHESFFSVIERFVLGIKSRDGGQ